jgi:hypothetical protein
MDTLINFIQTQPWYGIVAAVIALASAIAAITPTPTEGSTLAKVYKIIDVLALNIGKAKDKGVVVGNEPAEVLPVVKAVTTSTTLKPRTSTSTSTTTQKPTPVVE